MPFFIVQRDITKLPADAIVNAANSSLLGGGGVDGAIHRAAGRELLEECRKLGGCRTGEAKATGGYRLPCKYVIHTVGPVWHGGGHGEKELLEACYRNSLLLAEELGCETVSFPLISSGAYGYPADEAMKVASGAVARFLEEHDMTVYLVIYGAPRLFRRDEALDGYIREHYSAPAAYNAVSFARPRGKSKVCADASMPDAAPSSVCEECADRLAGAAFGSRADSMPDEVVFRLDESFSRNLLRRITASGMTDAECYKRANIDRKLFSKIRSNEHYRPTKQTALAFAVALRLDLENTEDLIRRAGFALSRSSMADVIVEYYISSGRYDIFEINETLYRYDQPLLGAHA